MAGVKNREKVVAGVLSGDVASAATDAVRAALVVRGLKGSVRVSREDGGFTLVVRGLKPRGEARKKPALVAQLKALGALRELQDGDDWSDFARRDAEENRLFELIRQAQPGSWPPKAGHVLRFPRGDGYALYLVVEDLGPFLKVEHIPTGDCWHVPDLVNEDGLLAAEHADMPARRMSGGLFGVRVVVPAPVDTSAWKGDAGDKLEELLKE